jgi:hypothetical protein
MKNPEPGPLDPKGTPPLAPLSPLPERVRASLGPTEYPATALRGARFRAYVTQLRTVLGGRFIMFLVFSQLLGKGILFRFLTGMTLPYFKGVAQVDAATLQIYGMLIMLPWSVKPLIGLASDLIRIYGYHKRGWLILAGVAGTASAGLLFAAADSAVPMLMVLCLMGVHFELSLYDLLSEAKYSEIRNATPEIGSNISTLVIGMQSLGSLVAMSCVGVLADNSLYVVLFAFIAALAMSPLPVTILGWLPETRITVDKHFIQLIDRGRLWKERRVIGAVCFCGLSGIAVSLTSTLSEPWIGLIVAGVALAGCLVSCWFAFPELIFRVALFQVITTLSQPSMGGALDYFYTADAQCLPGGPAFSYVYYITYAGIVGIVFALLAAPVYQLFLSRLWFRSVLVITPVLVSLAGLSDFFIVTRTNLRLGIPDRVAYMIGEAVLEPLLDMLNWIPTSALIALAVPHGMEASAYAFMAGLSNFARMVSELSGAYLFKAAGVVTSGETCNFSELAGLVLGCHVLAPAILCVPAAWIIPDMPQTGHAPVSSAPPQEEVELVPGELATVDQEEPPAENDLGPVIGQGEPLATQ